MTQKNAILEYLRAGNTLTPLEALNKFGCFRLGARIWDLKQEGWNIESKLIELNGKHVSGYRIPLSKQPSLFGGGV